MKKLLHDAGYILDTKVNVWSNPNYRGIAYNDGDEIETRIANIIRNAQDITTLSTELRQNITDWPSQYHLTSERANIMRPFESILNGAQVLEIGAGCGAISRYLGESDAHVLSLEGSPRRASIARSRTRDLSNVSVLTEKFDQFKCHTQFDVITLIGVLEYANLFTPGHNPALTMLQRVRELLKPEGKLIIAIENQLGLKYFAGAPEDHFGQAMVGIEGRYGKDQAQTFGRSVLTELLRQAGFEASNFLAPFPDYKLPTSIVTEAGFAHTHFDASAFASQSVRRDPQLPEICNFSQELAWPVVFANDLGLDMTNSFLVITSPRPQTLVPTGDLAYHYSTTRLADFCKETIFSSQDAQTVSVEYRRLKKLGATFHHSATTHSPIQFISQPVDQYVLGTPLSQEFIQIVTKDGWTFEQVGQFIKHYLAVLKTFENSGLNSDQTSPNPNVLPGQYIDCIPQNIIIDTKGIPTFIDKEWQLASPVEVNHLVFRSILMMCSAITRFGRPAGGENLTVYQLIEMAFKAAGLSCQSADMDRFESLEAEIQMAVSGIATKANFQLQKSRLLPTMSLNQQLADRDGQIAQLKQRIEDLQNSASWKLMSPLRSFSGKIKALLG
ncbi:MAG TPA: methyltransferase [Burkholderiaceae bacterium]|nr:methyltransferase [Burkholderiaceae bacterium]